MRQTVSLLINAQFRETVDTFVAVLLFRINLSSQLPTASAGKYRKTFPLDKIAFLFQICKTICQLFQFRTPQSIQILVGTNDLKNGGTIYKAEKLINHEKYGQPAFAYDIGLIQVEGTIEFTEKVQPIKYSNTVVPGDVALQATGWGRLSVSLNVHTKNDFFN